MRPFPLILLLLASTLSVSAKKAPPMPILLASKYILVKLWDGNSLLKENNSRYVIQIDQANHRIQAYFGCNRMSGPFHTKRYIIEQPIQMIAPEEFCTQVANDLEQLFGRGMSLVNHFTIVGNILRFYQDDQLIFEFRKGKKSF